MYQFGIRKPNIYHLVPYHSMLSLSTHNTYRFVVLGFTFFNCIATHLLRVHLLGDGTFWALYKSLWLSPSAAILIGQGKSIIQGEYNLWFRFVWYGSSRGNITCRLTYEMAGRCIRKTSQFHLLCSVESICKWYKEFRFVPFSCWIQYLNSKGATLNYKDIVFQKFQRKIMKKNWSRCA